MDVFWDMNWRTCLLLGSSRLGQGGCLPGTIAVVTGNDKSGLAANLHLDDTLIPP
jgi:hypothetical protein